MIPEDKIVEKVIKLLRQAKGTQFPEEAKTARRMAGALIQEHGITNQHLIDWRNKYEAPRSRRPPPPPPRERARQRTQEDIFREMLEEMLDKMTTANQRNGRSNSVFYQEVRSAYEQRYGAYSPHTARNENIGSARLTMSCRLRDEGHYSRMFTDMGQTMNVRLRLTKRDVVRHLFSSTVQIEFICTGESADLKRFCDWGDDFIRRNPRP